MRESNIELKVGILVLTALVMLVAFVFAMGGIHFEKTYVLYVDFGNPGWLAPGAMVKVSGVEAGKVQSIKFMGGKYDPAVKHRVYVRLELKIRERFKEHIHEDAQFYISSQGVLGEQYVEIFPGTYEKPYLKEGSVVEGVTPPKLEVAVAKGYVIIDVLHQILTENRDSIDGIITALKGIAETTDKTLKEREEDIGEIITNIKDITASTKELVTGARKKYVDNPQIGRIISNTENITGKLSREIGPILKSARGTLEGTSGIFAKISTSDVDGLKSGLRHISYAAVKADDVMGKIQKIVDRVERGEGTVGAILKDEELFDDLREMVRDLKHNPWKMFWKD